MARIVTTPPGLPETHDGVLGGWWHELPERGRIVCDVCPRACALKPGDRGFCFVRQNIDGEMVLTTYGRSTGFCIDPIEKKPLNHFYPGTAVLSFGTAGCNLGCKFCQNWDISKSREVDRASERADPATIAEAAVQLGCHSVAFTYNDPVIWAEYAIDTARACRERGIHTVAVTAGYVTPEARGSFFEYMDAANVDLKAFHEQFYQELTYSHLQPVLDTLAWLRNETEVWLELTTLLIPGENDSPDEIRRLCDWVLETMGDDVPLHFTAFHPAFRLTNRPPTPPETLIMAYDIAAARGLHFVYVGNVHDPRRDSTYCPDCQSLLIERSWHELGGYHLHGNRCGFCDRVIAGHFAQHAGTWGRRRLPVRIADFAPPTTSLAPLTHTTKERAVSQPNPSPSTPATTVPAGQSPQLTPLQKSQIFRSACDIVVSAICNQPSDQLDPTWGGVAELPIEGAFVTLKRRSHLRACCGFLGTSLPLREAVHQAAYRTATSDNRLPPISPTELPHLQVTVSILHGFRQLPGGRQERLRDVVVGQHGLRIEKGGGSGLLLPSVATDHDWDAEMFLRQVCRKAGLPATAWWDAAARVQTFEAIVIDGPLAPDAVADAIAAEVLFREDELQQLVAHCRANIVALAQGATPNYYLPSCRDANVQGTWLQVHVPARGLSQEFVQLSLRPGLPLQATLLQSAEAAAKWLTQQLPHALQPSQVNVDLAVLYDSALHGTVASPDLRGFDARHRALLVVEQGRYACVLNPDHTPEQTLANTTRLAQVLNPELAGVFSVAAAASCPRFQAAHRPAAQSGPDVRPPAVAGMFYPGQRRDLDRLLDDLCAGDAPGPRRTCRAILVPHAGLKYSGRIAAQVWQQVAIPDRVIIFAPKHTRAGAPWAVAPHHAWAIPDHHVPGDPELARRLAESIPQLELDAAAHRDEHAIEVQLPLLARLAPHARMVGVVISYADWNHCQYFAQSLARFLQEDPDPPLLVISSDMNHFAAEQENRRLDEIALRAIGQHDPAHLLQTVQDNDISMCGVIPATIVLETLRLWGGLNEHHLVAYSTSADAGGDTDRVVGYAGLLFP